MIRFNSVTGLNCKSNYLDNNSNWFTDLKWVSPCHISLKVRIRLLLITNDHIIIYYYHNIINQFFFLNNQYLILNHDELR